MQAKNSGYMAGIIDGEGCISIYIMRPRKKGKHVYRTALGVSCYQSDERLMKWIVEHYGGKYYQHNMDNSTRIGFSWRGPTGAKLELFLLEIIPYLIVKKDQALLALEYLRTPPKWEFKKTRFELARRCYLLNRKKSHQKAADERYQEAMEHFRLMEQELSPEANTQDGSPEPKIESELQGDLQSATVVTRTA